jgi:hypothetical protein
METFKTGANARICLVPSVIDTWQAKEIENEVDKLGGREQVPTQDKGEHSSSAPAGARSGAQDITPHAHI